LDGRSKGERIMGKSELDDARKITCENCGKHNVWGRRVKVYDRFGSTDRGYVDMCFECHRPTREFTSPTRGIMYAPLKEETYQKWKKQKETED